jgi:hypothetical protein
MYLGYQRRQHHIVNCRDCSDSGQDNSGNPVRELLEVPLRFTTLRARRKRDSPRRTPAFFHATEFPD